MHDGAVLGQHHERTLVLRRPLFARLDSLIARLLLMADLPSQPAASKQHNRGCYLPVSPSLSSEDLLNRLAEPLLLNFLHPVHAASPPLIYYGLYRSTKSSSSLSKADRSTADRENFALKRHQTLNSHIYPGRAQRAELPLPAPELMIPQVSCEGQAQPGTTGRVPWAELLAELCWPRPPQEARQGLPRRSGSTLGFISQHHARYSAIKRPFRASGGSASSGLTLLVPVLISYILKVSGSYCTDLFSLLTFPSVEQSQAQQFCLFAFAHFISARPAKLGLQNRIQHWVL